MKKYLLLWVAIIAVFAVSYHKVPFLFFQQDEIFSFGFFNKEGINSISYFLTLDKLTHVTPITFGLSYLLYLVFGLNWIPFNILGLIFHALNGVLICLIVYTLFKDKMLSLISLLIFYSMSGANELIMWPVANLNVLCLSFGLLSVYVVIKAHLRDSRLNLLESIILPFIFLMAVFSMEYAIFLAAFIPIAVFVLNGLSKKTIVSLAPFFVVTASYYLLRFLPYSASEIIGVNSPFKLTSSSFFTFPITYLGQLFAGQDFILSISKFISSFFFGISENWIFAEKIIYGYVATFFAVLFLLVFFRTLWVIKKKNPKSYLYSMLFLLFIFMSALPFLLVPNKDFSIIPSRYLYFGTAGLSILFAILYSLKKGYMVLILVLVTLGTMANYGKAESLYRTGETRREILNIIKRSYPDLPRKVVFYITSDISYFGLPDYEKVLPFQSGLGQTLLVWYYPTERFPKQFFENRFLWDIPSQGYEEVSGIGFGYFRDVKLLRETLKKYNLGQDSVIAFRWSDATKSLTNITSEFGRQAKQ